MGRWVSSWLKSGFTAGRLESWELESFKVWNGAGAFTATAGGLKQM